MSRTGTEDVLIVAPRDRSWGCKSLEAVGGVGRLHHKLTVFCLFNRQKLTAEMADNSNLIKALVIKAEDARIVGDMKLMKRYHAKLFALSTTSWCGGGEYTKRSNNHKELLNALKE